VSKAAQPVGQVIEEDVGTRDDQQGQDGGDEDAADNRNPQGLTEPGSSS